MKMIHKKAIGLLCLLVFSMLIAGCGGTGPSKESSSIEKVEVYQGTGAVEVSFSQGIIPNYDVVPPHQLQLSADIVNKGAHEITNGQVMVEGLTGLNSQQFDATGRTEYQEQGYPVRVEFNEITIKEDKQFLLTACYPYKTWLKGTFCYDPDLSQDSTRAKPCNFESHYSLSGQGAPLAITDVDIRRQSTGNQQANKAGIVIRVQNLGDGKVRSPTNPTIDCQGQAVTQEHKDKIKISKLIFNGVDIKSTCTPKANQGVIPLYAGSVILDCEASNLNTAGLLPFEIELEYGYVTQSLPEGITVQKNIQTIS